MSLFFKPVISPQWSFPVLLKIGVRSYAGGPRTKHKRNSPLASVPTGSSNKNRKQKAKGRKGNKKNDPDQAFNFGEYGGLKKDVEMNMDSTNKLIQKISNFDQLLILPPVRDAVKEIISKESLKLQDSRKKTSENIIPSPIQTVAVKRISKSLMDPKLQIHAIAAETGSGKTMAYLIPLIDYLKRQELETPELWETLRKNVLIRSIILVPTHELVDQVYDTVSKTKTLLGLNSFKWDKATSYRDLLENIKNRIDILVTTPGKLLNLFSIRMITRPDKVLSKVGFIVLDEADTLLDRSWLEETHSAIKRIPNINHLILCSATIPQEFNKTMQRLFPTVVPIMTPRLHKLPFALDFKVINSALSPFKGSKIKALAQTLYAISNDDTEPGFEKRCIIFVNEKKNVPEIVNLLNKKFGHNAIGLTGEDTFEERSEKIMPFLSSPRPLSEVVAQSTSPPTSLKKFEIPDSNIVIGKLKNTNSNGTASGNKSLHVLVTTDLMARGLNFKGVRNVVLYDVPKTSIDLIHRVGRTARMKQGGRVFMLTDSKTKSWAKALPKIIKKHQRLS
ncbi:XXYS1_4_G0034910.mRNA.1.CDS.1 [Saccharomyces cerevisiae]|nr:EM14S01-3B_G0032320.mRNA.1.CDS.1 [Saccharomyces cerevisiae]CAD6625775.1 XXYS1_4_G0034910.mRNA.1.CDS.1 [Saccharomyces cerevisiae]CAI4466020.1 AMH_1a_G0019320.mRNA.1.CDS.1 [Saccharomyces cerevisiae]CAI4474810.1 CEI_1a_G0019260.mRNA.1.CDS.1 [Saccharomyces cerevisiae]CAI6664900.1 AMH_1a_G0019320.mRNA.1.CDS.1 [Saccharomyces cerevisiae]